MSSIFCDCDCDCDCDWLSFYHLVSRSFIQHFSLFFFLFSFLISFRRKSIATNLSDKSSRSAQHLVLTINIKEVITTHSRFTSTNETQFSYFFFSYILHITFRLKCQAPNFERDQFNSFYHFFFSFFLLISCILWLYCSLKKKIICSDLILIKLNIKCHFALLFGPSRVYRNSYNILLFFSFLWMWVWVWVWVFWLSIQVVFGWLHHIVLIFKRIAFATTVRSGKETKNKM